MSAEVTQETLYGAWCGDCAWGDGRIDTTEEEAEEMARRHDAEHHAYTGTSGDEAR